MRLAAEHVAGNITIIGCPGRYTKKRLSSDDPASVPAMFFASDEWEFTDDGWLIVLTEPTFRGREPVRSGPDYGQLKLLRSDLDKLRNEQVIYTAPVGRERVIDIEDGRRPGRPESQTLHTVCFRNVVRPEFP